MLDRIDKSTSRIKVVLLVFLGVVLGVLFSIMPLTHSIHNYRNRWKLQETKNLLYVEDDNVPVVRISSPAHPVRDFFILNDGNVSCAIYTRAGEILSVQIFSGNYGKEIFNSEDMSTIEQEKRVED